MVGALGALDWRSLAQSTDHGHGPKMSAEGVHYFGCGLPDKIQTHGQKSLFQQKCFFLFSSQYVANFDS